MWRVPGAALRALIGTISVFDDAGKLYGRLGVDPRRSTAVNRRLLVLW